MTSAELKKWMATHKPIVLKPRYTVTDLARVLGVSRQMIYMYLDGRHPIPHEIEVKLLHLD